MIGLGLGLGMRGGALGGGSPPVDTSVTLTEGQGYTAGPYGAFPAMWYKGIDPTFNEGDEFTCSIVLEPEDFPSNVEINWSVPGTPPASAGVYGYLAVYLGNYDGGRPPTATTPWQVGNLTSFTETFALTIPASGTNFIVLNEFYLTNASGAENDKAFEIAHWLHAPSATIAYFDAATQIGTFTDPQSRVWDVANFGPNPMGADYIVFLLDSRANLLSGTIDKKAALDWLVTQGVIQNHLWINGTAIGIEPVTGSGSATLNSYSVDFAGSGAEIPMAVDLITNGDFDTEDNWTGLWYSGKSYDYGAQRIVFDATPAYDGIAQTLATAPVAGKEYQLTYTITRTAGSILPRLSGGTNRNGAERSASGTYTERLLANTGNTTFEFLPMDNGFTGTIDNVSLIGPFDPPVVSLAPGATGYAGSELRSTIAGQWTANGTNISGATGTAWTVVPEHEGKAIRCGQSNAIEVWVPSDTARLAQYDVRQPSGVTVIGGLVSSINDLAGSRHLVQATGSQQPSYGAAHQIAGYDTPRFDGTSDFVGLAANLAIPTAGDISILLVADVENVTGTIYDALISYGSDGTAGTWQMQRSGGGTTFPWYMNAGTGVYPGSITSGNTHGLHIWELVFDFTARTWRCYFDGALQYSNTHSAKLPNKILKFFANRNSDAFIAGKFGAALVLSSVDAETRQKAEGCLAHQWGITANLPSDHPYKTNAPTV